MAIELYEVNAKYIDYLVPYAPHLFHNKQFGQQNERKYIGIVLVVNNMKYFAPLSSFKPKHEKMKNGLDFIKVGNYAVININNMFPVPDGEYSYVDIPKVKNPQYRKLLTTEYRIIRKLQDKIKSNATQVYKHKINHGDTTALAKRCNDFKLLEEKCEQFVFNLQITKVYFVRHAQPEHMWEDDRTRPLTAEGKKDAEIVLDFLKNKEIDVFYSSPYKRSFDTIADAAAFFGKKIFTDERLREREKGMNGNCHGMFEKRWADHDYHEENGESINMVQKRNIAALTDILTENKGKKIVIGTHGTALSAILNFYYPNFGCKDFLRIIDWMPYIIELDFDGDKLLSIKEQCYIEKEFQGDKKE